MSNLGVLQRVIRSQLDPSLLKKEYRDENKHNPMFGHCYVATEALYHLIRILDYGDYMALKPHHGKDDRGITHWWLQDGDDIVDVTKSQYTRKGVTPPYDKGKAASFLTKYPSKRAVTLINKVQKRCASIAQR